MKKLTCSILLSLGMTACASATAALNCADYPHWTAKYGQTCPNTQLQQLDNFITQNANKGYVAAFDWDGTLYGEQVVLKGPEFLKGMKFAGQPAWLIWSATHLVSPASPYFPSYRYDPNAMVNQVLYLEGKTNAALGDYSKFSQEGNFIAGMTPQQVTASVNRYLQTYRVDQAVFLPMMDILQRLHNQGFKLWIVTGSNPYYVAPVLREIESEYGYHFGILPSANNGEFSCHMPYPGCIAGNAPKLLGVPGTFSTIYDNKFTAEPGHLAYHYARYPVDQAGKALAIQNFIQRVESKPVILYAGNSGGDYQAALYVLKRHESDTKQYPGMVIAVHPQNESSFNILQDIVTEHAKNGDIVKFNMNPQSQHLASHFKQE